MAQISTKKQLKINQITKTRPAPGGGAILRAPLVGEVPFGARRDRAPVSGVRCLSRTVRPHPPGRLCPRDHRTKGPSLDHAPEGPPLDLVPRRTIRVVMFMTEENGTAGARAYRDAPADEMARHFCALESDNGGFTPRGFTVDGPDEALALVKELAAPLASIGAGRITPGSGGVDIGYLKPRGVPLIGFRPAPQRYFDVHHSENDVLASVSKRELHLGAAAVTSLVYMLAEVDAPLARNEVSE